jgi:hypothetical protein
MASPRPQQSLTATQRRVAEENRQRARRGEGRIATVKDARGRLGVVPGVTLLDGGQGRGPVVQA